MAFRTVLRSSVIVGCARGFSAVPNGGAYTLSGMGMLGRNSSVSLAAKNSYLRPTILTSSFSTVADPNKSQLDSGDVQALFERDHFVKLKARIEKDDRKRLSLKEYQALAAEEGLTEEQASRLLRSLNDSGIVLHFSTSSNTKLQNTIFLKPQELNSTIHQVLEQYSPTALKHQAEVVQSEIKDLTHQLEPLTQQRDVLETKASRRANLIIGTGLGYCVLQFLAIGRLTWWELSWDVMEPVTYMLTFGTALIGYSFFVITGSEYTYEGLKKTLKDRRLKKLIKKTGFDEAKFKQLHIALQNKEQALHKILEEVSHSGPGPQHFPPLKNTTSSEAKPATA